MLNLICSYPMEQEMETEKDLLQIYKLYANIDSKIPSISEIVDCIMDENAKRILEYAIINSNGDESEINLLCEQLDDSAQEMGCFSNMESYVFDIMIKYGNLCILDDESSVVSIRFFGNVEHPIIVCSEAQNLLLRAFMIDDATILANRIIVTPNEAQLLLKEADEIE